MKIKTITCHEVYNHGASLQEYALLYYLNQLGHQAEAIHYKPKYLSNYFQLSAISNPIYNKPILKELYLLAKLSGRIRDLKRKKAFDTFSKKYIKTGNCLYQSNEDLKANLPDADAFICGSDQIWNSFFENGKDPAFYLDFAPTEKLKISYAASFAIDEIEESLKPFVKTKIDRLNSVSVRETSGVRILEELGIEEVRQVLDPVFLLEPSHWQKTFVFPIEEKYVFVYDFDNNSIVRNLALKLAKENNWKIYTVNQNISYADKNFYYEGPEYFLSLVANAAFVISNSFHAVAFSLIFEKQFVVVNREEKINTRMRDLLSLFDLSQLLITKEEDVNGINFPDYDRVNIKIKKAVQDSKTFLKKALIEVNTK